MLYLSLILVVSGPCCLIWRNWFVYKHGDSDFVSELDSKTWPFELIPLAIFVLSIFTFDLYESLGEDVMDLVWIDIAMVGWIFGAAVFFYKVKRAVRRFRP
ncbi:hypothetical protein CLV36_11277 [Laceyella sediminis]|uniref:Uncharacterized protein n=1 Tax=Laceyella sediminis TaxID=573074 RepID=A0ABX5EL69_9BACL|nr:hypothetical protein CLV36_11277 [Laceyella sediminis]